MKNVKNSSSLKCFVGKTQILDVEVKGGIALQIRLLFSSARCKHLPRLVDLIIFRENRKELNFFHRSFYELFLQEQTLHKCMDMRQFEFLSLLALSTMTVGQRLHKRKSLRVKLNVPF